MLHSIEFKAGTEYTFVQIQIPCTSGTLLRPLFQQSYGEENCLDNYYNEIQKISSTQLSNYRLIVGHFAYGIHHNLSKLPIYISMVRNPIDRYIATYSAFKKNTNSPYHQKALQMDINQFLRYGINSDIPGLKNQFNNLQCRLICGQENFKIARKFIDEKFFLVCPESKVQQMGQILSNTLNIRELKIPQNLINQDELVGNLEKTKLSADSIALLLETENEDLLLYNYVERAFAALYEEYSFTKITTHTNNILSNLSENSVIKTLIQDQAKSPENFKFDICKDDEMYLFSLSNINTDQEHALVNYFAMGKSILEVVKQVVEWQFSSFNEVTSFLDFASGYGRFTRFLIQEIQSDKVWASDVYKNAISFQKEYLNVNGIISNGNPNKFQIDRKFDCILANSFFSHMPESTFTSWLHNLYSLLTERGILMFTVHGENLLPAHIPMPENGILFSANSESQSLDMEEYGTSYVREDFVLAAIARVSNNRAIVHRIPNGMVGFQDLYIVTNHPNNSFSELKFHHQPKAYVDVAALTNQGDLYLDGWAFDSNDDTELKGVQIFINGVLIHSCAPSYDRPDVARYFNSPDVIQSGWHYVLQWGSHTMEDVILIKVMNSAGANAIIECCRIKDLLAAKHTQCLLQSTQEKLNKLARQVITE